MKYTPQLYYYIVEVLEKNTNLSVLPFTIEVMLINFSIN